ncbi:MAG: hypothetical protein LBT86_03740 [Deltaproteobacteria bacterium]|jgi:hypothetical protein|nr:hypothetical protein [Deltaproteobacteria bacterium]
MPRQLIHSGSLSQSHILELNGVEIILNYIALGSIIEEYSPNSRVILAEPVKNLQQDRINWFSDIDDELVALNALPPEQQAQAQTEIDKFVYFISDLSKKLLSSSLIKDKNNGELLARIFNSLIFVSIIVRLTRLWSWGGA